MIHYNKDRDNATLGKFYTDHVSAMTREGLHKKSDIASELAVRDARIAEMERDNERIDAQWRDELRIYRETENKRIAELETAMKRQTAAVKMIDMSHVARAETMMQHAQVLHDQSNTAALESERAANALLTERIAELERECQQWRLELRIFRETENARIAELEQSVTVRDTEIARLETDLEVARRDAERYRWLARFASYSHIGQENGEWFKRWTFAGPLAYALEGETLGEAIDKARAGNGGGV